MKRIGLLLLFLNSISLFGQDLINDKCRDIKEPEIVSMLIMDENYEKETEVYTGKKFNLLIQTCNFEPGEEINVTLELGVEDEEYKEISTVTGLIEEDGYVRIKDLIVEKNYDWED